VLDAHRRRRQRPAAIGRRRGLAGRSTAARAGRDRPAAPLRPTPDAAERAATATNKAIGLSSWQPVDLARLGVPTHRGRPPETTSSSASIAGGRPSCPNPARRLTRTPRPAPVSLLGTRRHILDCRQRQRPWPAPTYGHETVQHQLHRVPPRGSSAARGDIRAGPAMDRGSAAIGHNRREARIAAGPRCRHSDARSGMAREFGLLGRLVRCFPTSTRAGILGPGMLRAAWQGCLSCSAARPSKLKVL